MFNSSDQLMFQCQSRQFQIQRNNYNDHNLGSNGQELAPNCPRCASPNTKFCYYNNYSLSQPRYFCKGCRRYWTKGGSLRNVPVGGGCRKSRRANSKYRISSVYSQHSNADSSSIQEGSNEGGADIDLAVVFSKFLNEDKSSPVVSEGNVDQIDQFGVNNMSNSPTLESYQSHQSGSIQDSDFFDGLTDQVLENGFGFENSGGNDQMGLWIDDGSWESGLMQFDHHQQDLDYGFPNLLDDQIKISANLLNQENWSSFDISGFNYS